MSVYEVIIRLLLAIGVGGIVGFEREHSNRPAGFRTHCINVVDCQVLNFINLV